MKAVCWASGFNKPPAATQCCLAQKKNNISINNSNNRDSGGTAQLVECLTEKPDAILMQVQVQSAARVLQESAFSLQTLFCFAYSPHVQLQALRLFGHVHIHHTLLEMGSAALVAAIALPS